MSMRSPSSVCVMLAVLLGPLALVGCPKRPEVGQAGPGAVGPAAAAAPSQPSPPAERRPGDVPVVRVIPPMEAPVAPPPASPPAPSPTPAAPVVPAAPAPAGPSAGPTLAPSAAAPVAGTQGAAGPAPIADVFFDYDKSALRGDQRAAVTALAARLKQQRQAKVTVEGHCDERGSTEYNLALGERRAKAIKEALMEAGVGADRILIVSYGEERPFVRGQDESAWKWNRRAHFVVSGQ